VEVWPYVNGKRWGAQGKTDKQGRAVLPLPLPHPGTALIRVAIPPSKPIPDASWIWAEATGDGQTVYFRRSFSVKGRVRRAALRMTCDDVFQAYLNGHQVASGSNFQKVQQVPGLERWLKPGVNVLAVEGKNGPGPAGLLARLEIETNRGMQALTTDGSWEVFEKKPESWPGSGPGRGMAAHVLAPVGAGVWGSSLQGWPGLSPKNAFPAGLPMPEGAVCSNTLRVQVRRRPIRVLRDPDHRVGIEWEPWFTPLNARWDTAEAVPIVGNYDSFNRDVIRQHCLWMAEAGLNFLLVDWTNNLWGKQHWSERGPYVNDLIRGTTLLLETYAQMRKEGIPVPQVTLILGLDNGPTTTMTAVNEEIQWIYENYVQNPRYQGLWLSHEGKPLILVFNGGGPAIRANQPPVDDSHFTVRWMASQLQINRLDREGYWSWMDGTIHPIPTFYKGYAEALTVTPAFFAEGGWTYPKARGRRGGVTYLEEFATALEHRPRFLIINQWNEFAGQPEGDGYGPKRDQYVDCYSAELSNDIEPTSLNLPAYRSKGGWGFYYLNLTRALVDLFHQKSPETTLLAISSPAKGALVADPALKVEWTAIGRRPPGFTLALDGHVVARSLQNASHTLDLQKVPEGRHVLSLRAEGAVTRYRLSPILEDAPLRTPVPAVARVEFFLKRSGRR